MTVIARFTVDDARPTQVAGLDADWVTVMVFSKTFTAGITGRATTLFVTSGEEGQRSYLATERISGRTEGGEEGEVTVQHGGLEPDEGRAFGFVVPGTGTGGFAGWSGSATIRHDGDGAYFAFGLDG